MESKIEYEELFKNISSCIAIYEATVNGNDFIFKYFNKAAEKTDKIKRKDVIGKSVLEVFPGVKDFGLFDVFKRVYKTGKPENYPITIYKDKRISGWRENFVYKLPNGEVVAVYNDLTEKKQAEEELIQTNKQLALAQKSAGAGVWDWDMNTGKLNWSPEFYILFGLDPKKDTATFDIWRKALHPEDRQRAEEKINESIKEQKPLFNEYRIVLRSGKIRWINALGNTIYDEHGKAVRMSGICIDITVKKKAEEEIKSLAKFPQENPNLVGRIDCHGKLLYCNHAYKRIFKDNDHIPSKLQDAIKKIVAEKIFNQEDVEIEIGDIIFLFNLIPIKEENYINFYGRDITELKKVQEDIAASEEKYRTLVEKVNEAILIVQDGIFVFANRKAYELVDIPDGDFIDKPFVDFVWPEDREMVVANYRKRIAGEILDGAYDFRIIGTEGKPIWVFMSVALIQYKGKPATLIMVTNITERKKTEEEILHLSFHDQLTGLYNRRFFEEELKRLDTKRQFPLSIIMGDLNGLKLINDVFGHVEGDELLKETAEILKKVCRSDDILARWGGDEFVILLPKTSIIDSEEIVQRIKKECKKTNSQKIPISFSLGAAQKETAAQDIQTVVIDAESNMYKNKLTEKQSISSSIIFALDQTLYEKSNETKEHTDRIHDLAIRLGKSVKVPSSQLDEVSLLASLHDIGKVAIPETILLKEGRLTEKEWTLIKRHPEIGFNIANASPQISHIAKGILSCHENWDGSGYPLKIKGASIPVISRIIFIADAYDIMTSGRTYKKAMSKDDAIKELKRCAGTQFDPVLVDKFIEIISNS